MNNSESEDNFGMIERRESDFGATGSFDLSNNHILDLSQNSEEELQKIKG